MRAWCRNRVHLIEAGALAQGILSLLGCASSEDRLGTVLRDAAELFRVDTRTAAAKNIRLGFCHPATRWVQDALNIVDFGSDQVAH